MANTGYITLLGDAGEPAFAGEPSWYSGVYPP